MSIPTQQTVIPACTKGSKFTMGEKFYCFNIGMQFPLISEHIVNGIINDDGLKYTSDKSMWFKEEYLFKSKKDAYKHLIEQAESEMLSPEIK